MTFWTGQQRAEDGRKMENGAGKDKPLLNKGGQNTTARQIEDGKDRERKGHSRVGQYRAGKTSQKRKGNGRMGLNRAGNDLTQKERAEDSRIKQNRTGKEIREKKRLNTAGWCSIEKQWYCSSRTGHRGDENAWTIVTEGQVPRPEPEVFS